MLTVLLFLKKAWAFIKRYWKLFALVIGTVVLYVLFKRQNIDFAAKLKEINDLHDAEIAKINKIREEERRQHEENERKLKADLLRIRKQYDEQKQQLDEKTQAEIDNLFKKYQKKPDVLAKKLSEAYGFTVILPQR
jgi:hypothetical protein